VFDSNFGNGRQGSYASWQMGISKYLERMAQVLIVLGRLGATKGSYP